MASIERRTGDNGKPQYRARWRDAEGRSRRSRWFDRKLDADRHRATVEADLHRGSYVDLSNPVTVAEYTRRHIDVRPYRPNTVRFWSSLLNHLGPVPLGQRPLVKVRPSDIQVWATGLAHKGLALELIRIYIGCLRTVFTTAVADGVVARNPVLPFNRITLPRGGRAQVVPLTIPQVSQLAAQMPDRYQAMVVTQAGLGLRVGELLALRVEDVNFLRRTAHVEHQLAKGSLARVEPKTPKSRRDVPLPQVVAETLAEHMRRFPPLEDGTIFSTPHVVGYQQGAPSGPVHHGTYSGHIARAARRIGLPGTSSHDLRHHYASVLLHAGESVHAVAERLGHVDAQLVLRIYGHLMPDQEDRTRRSIDAAWRAAAADATQVAAE